MALPALTEEQEELLPDSLALADLRWWEIYSDATLQELILKALNHNKDIQIAVERIEELRALRRAKTAELFPEINGNIYYDREFENYRGEKHVDDLELGTKIRVGWEVDLWGNIRWGREKSTAEYLQSIEARRSVEMTLVAGVARAYFELVVLDNELAIVRQTLHTREEGVNQARLRFEGGLTSETSYQQAQVELASTATLIPELEHRITIKENEISLLTGEFPGRVPRTTMDQQNSLPEHLPVGLSSDLLKRRPDVRMVDHSLRAANAAVGIAYTDRFPRIVLTGAYGTEGDQFSTLMKSPYGIIIGTLTTPVFAFGKKQAKYKAQQRAYEQELHRYEKKVLTVFKEVSDAMVSYNSIKQARELKSDLERASKSYVDLAQLQYINGVINYLNVLDAHRRYFDAQIGLSNAIRDEYLALVELYKVLGGGWSE
ncbi:MAG: efflux transporter outer membrane subunit [Bacteroides sp.]|nr:efflux transporter outer membrane subunit [Bacteroides sp.]